MRVIFCILPSAFFITTKWGVNEMATTYNNLYLDTRARLKKAGVEAAQLEARELLCYAADKSREQLYRDMSLYVSAELEHYMQELAAQSDKLSVEQGDPSKVEHLPCVQICRSDGSWTGLAFHGVPGGHEFTSFVLGLYNTAGPGQPLDEKTLEDLGKISRTVNMKILVSLSCTMCPELVTAAQRIAAENPFVTAEVYDLNHFPALKDRYQVMSVPCLVINDGEKVVFGKKNVGQVVELINSL